MTAWLIRSPGTTTGTPGGYGVICSAAIRVPDLYVLELAGSVGESLERLEEPVGGRLVVGYRDRREDPGMVAEAHVGPLVLAQPSVQGQPIVGLAPHSRQAQDRAAGAGIDRRAQDGRSAAPTGV
jgi:hypothetical protein